MIEAVLFDGDQTLWDFQRVLQDALMTMTEEMRAILPGPFTGALTWDVLNADRNEVAVELQGVEFNLARLRRLGFERTLRRLRQSQGGDASGDAELAQRLTVSYFDHRERDPALFADTIPCLDVLRFRYRLGLLSNGSRQPDKIGLGGYFDSVVFAQDHRVVKPDQGIFEVSERELGVAPSACVLVGDHPLNDVAGAKRAGWFAVWLDRDGVLFDGDQRPDAVVTTLDDLPHVLETLEG
jgi:HAD superfamily hydrolase (TIGR01509 family)